MAAGSLRPFPTCLAVCPTAETREEAARNVEDAIASWLEEARLIGRAIPEPRAALHIA